MFCKKSVRWLYRLEKDFNWESGLIIPEKLVFRDKVGKVRLIIEKQGRITITKGYSWNGCSPKICIIDILIGTPDGVVNSMTGRPKAYYASLVHDALYQFLRDIVPLTRADADRYFLRLLKESEFQLAYLYWFAVRLVGWLVWRAKMKKRNWQGKREVVSDVVEGA